MNIEIPYSPEEQRSRAQDDATYYNNADAPTGDLNNCYAQLILGEGYFKLCDTENENNYVIFNFKTDADDSGLETTYQEIKSFILDNQIYVVNKDSFEFLNDLEQSNQNTLIAEMDIFDVSRRDIVPSFDEFRKTTDKIGDSQKMQKSPKGFASKKERLKHYQNSDIKRTDHFQYDQFNSTYNALDKSKGKKPQSEETPYGKWRMGKMF